MSNRYRATAYLSLFISKKKIYKTITRFGFCNIRDNQGLGKCYQRRPSPHPIIIYEYVQHSFIQHSLRCLQQFLHKTIKAWSTKKFFFTNRHKNLEWETYSLRELKKPSFKKKKKIQSVLLSIFQEGDSFIDIHQIISNLKSKVTRVCTDTHQLFPINFIYCKSFMYCKFLLPFV